MNYLAIDRPDIMYAVNELARKMSKPDNADLERMRRLARFLKVRPRSVTWYRYQEEPNTFEVFTDSDWAGCRVTRRSTSGGCAMAGTHFIKAWSKTQATRALSSAEAELHAVVKATSEGIGIKNIMKDFGRNMVVCILIDASAALGIVRRKGVGRVRHLDTDLLWVQDTSESKEVKYSKIEGSRNPADLLTKYLSSTDMRRFVCRMGMEYRDGHDDQGLSIALTDTEQGSKLCIVEEHCQLVEGECETKQSRICFVQSQEPRSEQRVCCLREPCGSAQSHRLGPQAAARGHLGH